MADKIGRNDPCPCGSGLKFKKCCIDRAESFAKLAAPAENAPKKEPFAARSRGASPFLDEFSGSGPKAGPEAFQGRGFDLEDDADEDYYDEDDYDDENDIEMTDGDGQEAGEAGESGKAGDYDEDRKRAEAVRAKTPDELFAALNGLGLPVTPEILKADAARHDSASEMCLEWEKKYRKIMNAREEMTLWETARILWEKLDPAGTPCLETVFDEINEGYKLWDRGEDDADESALGRWLAAWDMMKASLGRISRTFDEIDRQVAVPEGGLEEWAEDICWLLEELAGASGGGEYETCREKFVNEFISAFRDFPAEVAVSLKCGPAERLFDDGKTAEADAAFEARAAAEFDKKYRRASLEEKLNMLDELCIGNSLRSFERFAEPVHYYETLAQDLADAGMIEQALGLAALLELRQPELFKYHFASFDYLRAMAKLAGGDAESAGRSIERLLNDDYPCYEYIALIAKAAAVGGMENAVAEECLAAARHYFMYESPRGNDECASDLKFIAAAIIFGEAYTRVRAGERIDEKDLDMKLFMTGWPGSSETAAKRFVEEIGGGNRQPARLDKKSLWKTEFPEFFDKLFGMSLQYFRRMLVEKGRGFVFSSIVLGFVIDFLMGRVARRHEPPDLERFFKFNKYELKDFALDRCRRFGDEKDKLPDTAAGLKLMKSMYEFLRDAGTVDDETCRNACAAAEWTLSKLLERYKKRAWQLKFIGKLSTQ